MFLIAYRTFSYKISLYAMEKSDTRNKIATRIKSLRKQERITQEKFALMTGLNRSYLADIEKGNRSFGIDTLDKIIFGFGMTYEEFFNEGQAADS